jgi:hypothetical protein
LNAVRGERIAFFVFADTVAAKNFRGTNEAHGGMGVRFQSEPNTPPSVIILHVRVWDKENVLQQQALGIVGVNLVFGAFYYLNLKAGMAGIETAPATQHQTNPIAPRWTFRVRTH